MKPWKVLALGFVFVVGVVALAVSFGAESEAAPQEPVKPIILKFTCPWPPTSAPMVRRKVLAARVAEKSGGKLKIELYGVGQLCDSRENFEAVQTGVADIGMSSRPIRRDYFRDRSFLRVQCFQCLQRIPGLSVTKS